jgi:hypothetical protein
MNYPEILAGSAIVLFLPVLCAIVEYRPLGRVGSFLQDAISWCSRTTERFISRKRETPQQRTSEVTPQQPRLTPLRKRREIHQTLSELRRQKERDAR